MDKESDLAEKLVAEHIQKVVEEHPNPDLVLKFMCVLGSDRYINHLHEKIGVSKEETEEILDFLAFNEFIRYIKTTDRPDLTQARTTKEAKLYPGQPFGEPRLFEDELDEIDTGRIMTAIEGIADFHYSRKTSVSVDRLDEMKKGTVESMEAIKKEENRILRNLLGLEDYERISSGFSFASEDNPLWDDHAGNLKRLGVGISLDYKSVKQAFIHGFEKARTHLKLDEPIVYPYLHREPITHSSEVLSVEKFKEKYRVYINNPLYSAMNEYCSFAYFQAVAKKVDALVERLKPIIPDMKEPVHRQ
jgi:hypothetical protein